MKQNILQQEINEIKNVDFPAFKDVFNNNQNSDEYLFSLVCYKYFYNQGEQLTKTIISNIWTDGKGDGEIDFICPPENFDDKKFVLCQSKSGDNIDTKDIIPILTRMQQTYDNLIKAKYNDYNDQLKRVFLEHKAQFDNDDINTELVLFLKSNNITNIKRKKIEKSLKDVEALNTFNCKIFIYDEIKNQIERHKSPKLFVSEGKIKINHKAGLLKNGDNGVIVSVYASSLKDLYEKEKNNGLFEQNFRYFVKEKKIDDKITKSIRENKDRFWFKNNGIIIACKDFNIDGDNIKLYEFSIINGCQTTSLIGDTLEDNSENNDFVLLCKIVKPENNNFDTDKYTLFVSELAESANSQKEIKPRDLKANDREQIELQKFLKDVELFLEIKRGVKTPSGLKKITNEDFGKLCLAFYLQSPATARSGKSKLFTSPKTYQNVFRKGYKDKIGYNKDSIQDLMRLDLYLNKFIEQFEDMSEDGYRGDFIRNGRFTILSIISFILRLKFQLLHIKDIKNSIEEDNFNQKFLKDNITEDEIENGLEVIFNIIVNQVASCYKNEYRAKEVTSMANFLKNDKTYQETIISHIISNLYNTKIDRQEFENKLNRIFI